jgi:nicotinamidase-related amidase
LVVIQSWCKRYFSELEKLKGPHGYILVWREHCVMATSGQTVVESIGDAILGWERFHSKTAVNVMKGQNSRVEIYSALEAEIEDPMDISTSLNEDLLSMLKIYDKVSCLYICFTKLLLHSILH